MNIYKKSKTSLFLMEMIATILLFSFCGAVCMKLFVTAHELSNDTRELNKAVAKVQGFAEVMRGTGGSIEEIVNEYPTAVQSGQSKFEVYYNEEFEECQYSESKYMCEVTLTPDGVIQNMDVVMIRMRDYKEIYTLNATKYMNKSKE